MDKIRSVKYLEQCLSCSKNSEILIFKKTYIKKLRVVSKTKKRGVKPQTCILHLGVRVCVECTCNNRWPFVRCRFIDQSALENSRACDFDWQRRADAPMQPDTWAPPASPPSASSQKLFRRLQHLLCPTKCVGPGREPSPEVWGPAQHFWEYSSSGKRQLLNEALTNGTGLGLVLP